MFIYAFVYLQRYAQSIVKYLEVEFANIFNSLLLLAIFAKALSVCDAWLGSEYVCNLSVLSRLSFIYSLLYLFIYLLFYLFISMCVSRKYILVTSCFYSLVLSCFFSFLFSNLYKKTFVRAFFKNIEHISVSSKHSKTQWNNDKCKKHESENWKLINIE